jgi:hypothetical protein
VIAIDPDDYRANRVGRTRDGLQVFVTTPFVPAGESQAGREFLAAFLFDISGKLLEAKIDDLGPRAALDRDGARRLNELGPLEAQRIRIVPFQLERFGVIFGLIPRPPEKDGDSWWVELHPGNYMAFHEPWDSGVYDT